MQQTTDNSIINVLSYTASGVPQPEMQAKNILNLITSLFKSRISNDLIAKN